jgi:mycofactocin precursor peptide peptidase
VTLADAAWPDLAGDGAPVIVLPLGSTEQHGPHLPIGTDTLLATELARRLVAARTGTMRAPALPFGASWEHDGFPGLLSLTTELLTAALVELARSADWARGILLVNGHGGNAAAVRDAAATIRNEGRRVLSWSPRLAAIADAHADADAHAGATETSMLLALEPALVRTDRIERGFTGSVSSAFGDGLRARSPTGVVGDPTRATVESGTAILDALTTDLLAAYDSWVAGT